MSELILIAIDFKNRFTGNLHICPRWCKPSQEQQKEQIRLLKFAYQKH